MKEKLVDGLKCIVDYTKLYKYVQYTIQILYKIRIGAKWTIKK